MHAAALRYVDEVARAGSIRRASERLNVAASAIDRQILKLEEGLGVQLFERLPRGLRLTSAGELVVRHARATLHDFTRLKGDIDELKGVKSGVVRIVCLDSLLVHFLPEVISKFHRLHPAVSFAVDSGIHGHVAEKVAGGEADIGITFNLPASPELDFFGDVPMPIMAMVARNHPLAGETALTLEQCAAYPLLLQRDIQPIRSLIDVELAAIQELRRPLVASNNMMLLKPLIIDGVGIAFYSPVGFLRELRNGDVRAIPLSGRPLTQLRLGLLVPRKRQPTPAATALTRMLRDELAELHVHLGGRAVPSGSASDAAPPPIRSECATADSAEE